jgi:putative selenium metabolism hydrolase
MDPIVKIRELAETHRHDTARSLSRLVRIPSLSCREGEVQRELLDQLAVVGMDELRTDGLGNVIGRLGGGRKTLAIDAHMDTVDVGNRANWEFDPYSGDIRDGYVLGRGSVDQKGGAAAFVTAARILKQIGVPADTSVCFVGSVMEEDCDGLCWKYLVEEEGLRPQVVISTEPTNCNLYRGHRGRMEIEAAFRGVSSHGSAPERGVNAIYLAAEACLAVRDLNRRLKHDDFLGKGSVTLTEFVSGSPSLCAVADYAKIHIDRRLTWGESRESAVADIEEIVKGRNGSVEVLRYREKAYTGLTYGMEKYYPTWKLPADHFAVTAGVRAYESLFGRKPEVGRWTFSTNAVTITGRYGIPTIGFGPGDEALAHSPNEKTAVDDLVTASAFYALYAHRFGSLEPAP